MIMTRDGGGAQGTSAILFGRRVVAANEEDAFVCRAVRPVHPPASWACANHGQKTAVPTLTIIDRQGHGVHEDQNIVRQVLMRIEQPTQMP